MGDKMVPTLGRIVHYKLNSVDADAINRRRWGAGAHMPEHRENANGVQVHVGSEVEAGQVFPMIITRVWAPGVEFSMVGGQVFLDGNDVFWVQSASGPGDGWGLFDWPPRA